MKLRNTFEDHFEFDLWETEYEDENLAGLILKINLI
jgi:hypothetical protein